MKKTFTEERIKTFLVVLPMVESLAAIIIAVIALTQ